MSLNYFSDNHQSHTGSAPWQPVKKKTSWMKKFAKSYFIVPLFLLVVIVGVQVFQTLFFSLSHFGIHPRHIDSLRGILFSPLIHGDWGHLINNISPLMVLSVFLMYFYKGLGYFIYFLGWILTGVMVWLFADLNLFFSEVSGYHIGASGVVYFLASFLFFSGIFKRTREMIAVSLVVVFLYGGMFWGMFPEELIRFSPEATRISWESHLFGAVVGLAMAIIWRKEGPPRHKDQKAFQSKFDARAQELWDAYLEQQEENPIEIEPKKKKENWRDYF